jgi:phosphotransferase system HPr (HPr) family protein
VKVLLPDALHARPANLLVRLASQHSAVVRLRTGARSACAHKILEVLALGAQKGEEIEIVAEGADAEAAGHAIAELVRRNFDADLVPERGSGAVEGIAIGRALVMIAKEQADEARADAAGAPLGPQEERARLAGAEARALAELEVLMAALGPEERALFEPEEAIVREVAAGAALRTLAGETSEEAVVAMTQDGRTDLLADARARLLDSLRDGEASADAFGRAGVLGEEIVVVADRLTPSLVARMPHQVVGIVAVGDEADGAQARSSHAAILARGRELPLAIVASHVAATISEGDVVVVDTTLAPARVWVAPGEALVSDARARKRGSRAERAELAQAIAAVSARLGVELLVNVGSLHDRVPRGAAGVGLLRTELLFAGRGTAPGEADQAAAILAVARAARGAQVTVRLWDAGGDKPLAWLPPRDDGERGAALLYAHPDVLRAQLAAIVRAAERAPVRALVPMTRNAEDVTGVKQRLEALGSGGAVPVGAMIETPDAVEHAAEIARAADFVCVGTNDLASLLLGEARTDASQALDARVLARVARVVRRAHAQGKTVTVCGELASDPRGARVLVGLGVDALSVASPRLEGTVRALESVEIEDCRAAAGTVANAEAGQEGES